MKLLVIFMIAVAMTTGCGPNNDEKRARVERLAASEIRKRIMLHENDFPNEPFTNINQLLAYTTNSHWPYPIGIERKLAELDRQRPGDSFFERYVLAPPGVTNYAFRGQLLLLSNHPFRGWNGTLGRMTISRTSQAGLVYPTMWLEETDVHRLFDDAGIPIPTATPIAPEAVRLARQLMLDLQDLQNTPTDLQPYSERNFAETIQVLFKRLAENLGVGRGNWFTVMFVTILALAVIATAIFLLIGKSAR